MRETVKLLTAHRSKQNEHRLKLGAAYEQNELIFASELGTPLEIGNIRDRHFHPTVNRAGLASKFRLYDLRHTCATLLLLAGENPKVISERLGHASIVLTLDVYSHMLPHMQQGAAAKLEKPLFGKAATP